MSTVKPIPVNLPFETVPERQGSPYLIAAAERAGIFRAPAKTPGEEWAESCPPRHRAEMRWQMLVRSLPYSFQDEERARIFLEHCTKDLGISKELATDVMRWGH